MVARRPRVLPRGGPLPVCGRQRRRRRLRLMIYHRRLSMWSGRGCATGEAARGVEVEGRTWANFRQDSHR